MKYGIFTAIALISRIRNSLLCQCPQIEKTSGFYSKRLHPFLTAYKIKNNLWRIDKISVCLIPALIFLIFHGIIFAQQHVNQERGLNANSYLSGNFDNVNLFNGNLTLTIPIGQAYKVGGGLQYNLTLVYNSNAWYFKTENQPNYGERTRAEVNPKTNAGMGWMLSLGAVYPSKTDGYNEDLSRQLYVAPDGSEHIFDSVLYPDRTQPGMQFTNDGSFLRMRFEAGLRKIEFPNGEVHTFGTNNLLSQIEDRFGNTLYVDTTSINGQWLIKEKCASCTTFTRQHKVIFTDGRIEQIQLTTFNYTESVYKFFYTPTSIRRHQKDNWIRDNYNIDVWMLSSLQLPANAGSYDFSYNTTGNLYSGLITSATLPTKGHFEWEYQSYTRPVNVLNPTPVCMPYCPDTESPLSSSDGILYKKIYNRPNGNLIGTYQYILGESSPTTPDPRGATIVTVRSPEGNDTVNYFDISFDEYGYNVWSMGLPFNPKKSVNSPQGTLYLSQEIYKGTAENGDKLRSVYVQYGADPKPGFREQANSRITTQRTVYEDGFFADIYYKEWNGLGKFQTTETGGNFNRGNTRTNFTNYSMVMPAAQSPWILNLFTSEIVTEGSLQSKTAFCFDMNNGFLKRKRIYKGSTIQPQDIFIEFTPNDDGNIASEKYYGGDKTGNAPQISLCNDFSAVPEYETIHTYLYGIVSTSKKNGQSFYITNNNIDQNTGLVSKSTNSSGISTKFEYDQLGRIKKTDSLDDADVFYTYTQATGTTDAQVKIERKNSENDSPLTEKYVYFDTFGRQAKEKEKQPDGTFSEQETKYNAMGFVVSTSLPGDFTKKTEYLNYDPFGRAGKIRKPDGSETLVDYTGISKLKRTVKIGTSRNSDGSISQTSSSNFEYYDRQGRLESVQENSGNNNEARATNYQYDIGNRINKVSINYSNDSDTRINVAHAANGGQANASSMLDSRFPANSVINGDRKGLGWGNGTGGWNDGTDSIFPDTLEVQFSGEKNINEINVFTLQDNFTSPSDPNLNTPFSLYGITDFDVRYFKSSMNQWVTVAQIRGNNKVWRQIILASPVKTQKLSIAVLNSVSGANPKKYSRIVEVEAYSAPTSEVVRQERTFNYDNRGFLYSETHPEIIGQVIYSEYDTMGQVGEKEEGGKILKYNYDDSGKIVNVKEGSAERLLKEFSYYPTDGKIKKATRINWIKNPFCIDSPQTPVDECDPNILPDVGVYISEEYTYNGREGRMDSRVTRLNEINPNHYKFNQTFKYDTLGNLTEQNYPECQNTTCVQSSAATPRTVKYAYTNGYLTKVWSDLPTPTNYASQLTYHANGMLNTVQHGNGITDSYALNPNNKMARPFNITFKKGATPLWTTGNYEYDGAGNVVKMGSDWFTYDQVNRIKEGTAGIGSNGNQRKQGYTYDTMGNILSITTTNEGGTQPVYTQSVNPATNRLASLYYDNSGNFLGVSSPTLYQYDALNMMKKLPGKTYLYGPNEERVWIVDAGYNDQGPSPNPLPAIKQTISLRGLGNEVLREYEIGGEDSTGNWSWKNDYIYRGSTLLSSETPAGRRDFHVDHLGTPRIITTANGSLWGYPQYFYPYGAEAQTLSEPNLKFTGHERDQNLAPGHSLDYMHARFYAYNNGRFINVDPGRDFDAKKPQSWNRYSYVRGNPINLTDPTGREGEQPQPASTDGLNIQKEYEYWLKIVSNNDSTISVECYVCYRTVEYQYQKDVSTTPEQPIGTLNEFLFSLRNNGTELAIGAIFAFIAKGTIRGAIGGGIGGLGIGVAVDSAWSLYDKRDNPRTETMGMHKRIRDNLMETHCNKLCGGNLDSVSKWGFPPGYATSPDTVLQRQYRRLEFIP